MIEVGANLKKKPLKVNFYALKPFGERGHKSECPACGDGLLLMARDSRTGELLADDCCTLCGQHFIYLDIAEVRSRGGR